MKLHWKDESGTFHHGSDGDFDPDLVKFSNSDGKQQAEYVGPYGTRWAVRSFVDDRDALVRMLQRSYAAWLLTPAGLQYAADSANAALEAHRKACAL